MNTNFEGPKELGKETPFLKCTSSQLSRDISEDNVGSTRNNYYLDLYSDYLDLYNDYLDLCVLMLQCRNARNDHGVFGNLTPSCWAWVDGQDVAHISRHCLWMIFFPSSGFTVQGLLLCALHISNSFGPSNIQWFFSPLCAKKHSSTNENSD